jgi:PII-like signaling protein
MPMIVEIVDSLENIEKFLPLLDELIKDGLVTIEQIRVIHYRA